MKAVITVVGKDMVGILASVSGECSKRNVNVIEVSQTLLQDMFCMIMLVDVSGCEIPFSQFAKEIAQIGEENNLVIHAMHEDIFNAMHKIWL